MLLRREIVIYLAIMMWMWLTWCNIEIKQKKQVLIILRVVMHDIKQCLQLIKKWKSYINELIVHFIAFNYHMNKQNIFNVPFITCLLFFSALINNCYFLSPLDFMTGPNKLSCHNIANYCSLYSFWEFLIRMDSYDVTTICPLTKLTLSQSGDGQWNG